MKTSVKNIGLDALSYQKFVTRSLESLMLDENVCQIGNYKIGPFKDESRTVKRLAGFDIASIERLSYLLNKHESSILRMVAALRTLPDDDPEEANGETTVVAPGISSFYLMHVLAALKEPDEIEEYLRENDWLDAPGGAEFLDLLVNFFSKHKL